MKTARSDTERAGLDDRINCNPVVRPAYLRQAALNLVEGRGAQVDESYLVAIITAAASAITERARRRRAA